MSKKIYLSGIIAHCDLTERREAFAAAERRLRLKGFDVINPFDNGLPQDADWHDHMRRDIQLLLSCDTIYMLRGWEHSKGAKLELDVASSCGLTVVLETANKQMDDTMPRRADRLPADPHDPLAGIDFGERGDENTPDDFAEQNAR